MSKWISVAAALAIVLTSFFAASTATAEVCNIKVVTDASPDYSDMDSMIRSITAKWPTMKEKCWPLFYWAHIARRQTAPMTIHNMELGDPIRQFNDHGFAICSTVAGINCAIWNRMGMKMRYWDIGNHTVSECFYDGRWHIYDDSMSALYTLCDGTTIAGVEDVGKDGQCAASGGRTEKFHIAKYHCLTATSANGFLTGSDGDRSLESEGNCFRPNVLQYRYYTCSYESGYRYILNLNDGDSYTRYYHRLDKPVKGAFVNSQTNQPIETTDCYVPTVGENLGGKPFDPDYKGFGLRGNGQWISHPPLTAADYKKVIYSESNIAAAPTGGLQPASTDKAGDAVFLVQSANVTTSMTIRAKVFRKSADDTVRFQFSVDNGIKWQDIPLPGAGAATGETVLDLKVPASVNGAYQTLVKVELLAKTGPADAMLRDLEIRTITQINSKTQPRLNIGKNTIYVGAGEQTESFVYWPNIGGDKYKELLADEKNVTCGFDNQWIYYGHLHPANSGQEGYVVYRMTAPNDLTKVTYGGRFSNRYDKEHIDMLYSLDEGKTWTQSWSLATNEQPWDTLHHETVEVPAGHKSILLKYSMFGRGASIYSLIMEGDYKVADTTFKPIEVTFSWAERQQDYSLVNRSHTQRVDKVPARYEINVGGADHPVMESLAMNLSGSSPSTQPARYGYSDGKDSGGEKYVGRWLTVGNNFAEGKPYTLSTPPNGGCRPELVNKILTDGVVGHFAPGGAAPGTGIAWSDKPADHEITVDLGKAQKCGAFRIHITAGWPWPDALRGQFRDKIEVLTSNDGKTYTSQGLFPMNLRFKDIALNYLLPDNEELRGCNFELILPKPVEAQYVRYKVTSAPDHTMVITEVQALDFIKYEPFDIRLALPDEKVKATTQL